VIFSVQTNLQDTVRFQIPQIISHNSNWAKDRIVYEDLPYLLKKLCISRSKEAYIGATNSAKAVICDEMSSNGKLGTVH
jgi:hypothetical protein